MDTTHHNDDPIDARQALDSAAVPPAENGNGDVPSARPELRVLQGGREAAKQQDKAYRDWGKQTENRKKIEVPQIRDKPNPPKSGAGRYEGAVAQQLRRGTPSMKKRPLRWWIQVELRAEQIRRALRMAGKPVDEQEVQQLAARRLEHEVRAWTGDPRYCQISTTAKTGREPHVHRLLLQAAQLRTPAGRELRQRLLDAAQRGVGAPAQRELAVAVILRNMLDDTPLSIRRHYEDFARTSWPTLEWAYFSPADTRPERRNAKGSGARIDGPLSEAAVSQGIQGRLARRKPGEPKDAPRPYLPGILDTLDPETFMPMLLLQTYVDLLMTGGWPNMLRVLSFDGTKAPVAKQQTQSASVTHERLLNGRISDEACAFGYHGDGEGWRGSNAIFATDPFGPLMAAGMRLVPASGEGDDAEPRTLIPLLHDFIIGVQRATGLEYLPLEYVTGDSAFNTREVCEKLVFCYGIQPVFPWASSHNGATVPGDRKRKLPWANNKGVPACTDEICDRHGEDLDLIEDEGFYGPAKRAELGLEPGQDIRPLIKTNPKLRLPRIRWRCAACKRTETTHPDLAPHIYTRMPHKDVHKPAGRVGRYQQRMQILGGRNASESLNFALKFRCWGLIGATTPRCVKTERQMLWYAYGRQLAISLKRLVNADGTMKRLAAEHHDLGLDQPGSFRRMHPHHSDKDEDDDAKAA